MAIVTRIMEMSTPQTELVATKNISRKVAETTLFFNREFYGVVDYFCEISSVPWRKNLFPADFISHLNMIE